MKLAGRRVLITGGGSGIGRATAELFAKEGAKVAILDRNATLAGEVAKAVQGVAFEADVTSEASVNSAVTRAAEALGGLDGLVHAAGISETSKFDVTDFATWKRIMNVNLDGTFLVCKAALPFLRSAGTSTIVTLASGQALKPGVAGSSYSASKAGVLNLTKALAIELAPNIRANVVCPGVTMTPMSDAIVNGPDKSIIEGLKNGYALKRLAQPQEIATAILFLTCSDSSFVTGVALAVDGGRTFH